MEHQLSKHIWSMKNKKKFLYIFGNKLQITDKGNDEPENWFLYPWEEFPVLE